MIYTYMYRHQGTDCFTISCCECVICGYLILLITTWASGRRSHNILIQKSRKKDDTPSIMRAVRRLFKRGVTFVTTPKPLVHACSCFLLSFTRHISGRWSNFMLLRKDLFGGCFVSFPGCFQSKHYWATFKSGRSQVWYSCKHNMYCITSVSLNYCNIKAL